MILMHLLKKYGLFEKRCLKIKYLSLFPLCRFKDRFSLINYCARLINSWSVSSIIVFDRLPPTAWWQVRVCRCVNTRLGNGLCRPELALRECRSLPSHTRETIHGSGPKVDTPCPAA